MPKKPYHGQGNIDVADPQKKKKNCALHDKQSSGIKYAHNMADCCGWKSKRSHHADHKQKYCRNRGDGVKTHSCDDNLKDCFAQMKKDHFHRKLILKK